MLFPSQENLDYKIGQYYVWVKCLNKIVLHTYALFLLSSLYFEWRCFSYRRGDILFSVLLSQMVGNSGAWNWRLEYSRPEMHLLGVGGTAAKCLILGVFVFDFCKLEHNFPHFVIACFCASPFPLLCIIDCHGKQVPREMSQNEENCGKCYVKKRITRLCIPFWVRACVR